MMELGLIVLACRNLGLPEPVFHRRATRRELTPLVTEIPRKFTRVQRATGEKELPQINQVDVVRIDRRFVFGKRAQQSRVTQCVDQSWHAAGESIDYGQRIFRKQIGSLAACDARSVQRGRRRPVPDETLPEI